MAQIDTLKQQQARLKKDIEALLDGYLIGTVAKPPSLAGYNLTTKVKGKTSTLYVRKNIAPMALEMSRRYKELQCLLQELSKINWEILKADDR